MVEAMFFEKFLVDLLSYCSYYYKIKKIGEDLSFFVLNLLPEFSTMASVVARNLLRVQFADKLFECV